MGQFWKHPALRTFAKIKSYSNKFIIITKQNHPLSLSLSITLSLSFTITFQATIPIIAKLSSPLDSLHTTNKWPPPTAVRRLQDVDITHSHWHWIFIHTGRVCNRDFMIDGGTSFIHTIECLDCDQREQQTFNMSVQFICFGLWSEYNNQPTVVEVSVW